MKNVGIDLKMSECRILLKKGAIREPPQCKVFIPWFFALLRGKWLYFTRKNSIRRFLALPSAVELGAMGSSGPKPLVIMRVLRIP
jgi:hypothetical protein